MAVLPTTLSDTDPNHTAGHNAANTQTNTNTTAITALQAATANGGTYSAITHSSAGALALNFDNSVIGFVVTASANITDITYSNGPAAGSMMRRILIVNATASITLAAGTLDVTDTEFPTSMANADSFASDLIVTA